MSTDNIAKFNLQVLRAVAALYQAHPRTITLDSEQILGSKVNRGANDFEQQMEESAGTVQWLHRNGIVTGTVEGGQYSFMLGAQLSSRAFAKLRAEHSNVGRPLGQAAVEALASGDERELAVVADLIVGVLT